MLCALKKKSKRLQMNLNMRAFSTETRVLKLSHYLPTRYKSEYRIQQFSVFYSPKAHTQN